MHSNKTVAILAACFVIGFFPLSLLAATLEGNVRIENEIPLTGVTVRATLAGDGTTKETKSDSMGRFAFSELKEGKWILDFSSPPPPQAPKGFSGELVQKTVHIRSDASNALVNIRTSNFSLIRIDLIKNNASLTGKVFLDKKKHGKTGEKLIVQAGLHELMARTEKCESETMLMEFFPWHGLVPISLECKD